MSKARKPQKNEKKQPAPNAKAPKNAELADHELESVTGGASDIFAKIGDIKGESLDLNQKVQFQDFNFSLGLKK